MANYFNSLNIALKSLQVQKKSLDVTGHNISNANTEGYSRQTAVHKASNPYTVNSRNMPTAAGQVGTGVDIAEIKRIRDQFIDGQINEENQALGYWQKKYDGLHRLELTLNEPSESSLGTAVTKFWESLQDLSNNPTDTSVRETVKQRAITMTDTFHTLHDQFTDYKISLNDEVGTKVRDVNSLARRIADLNREIAEIKGSGNNPNDLMDNRDQLFKELNQIVDVQGTTDNRGNLNISIGGIKIVNNDDVHELMVEPANETEEPGKEYENKVVFAKTGAEAIITGGELAGIMEIRDDFLASSEKAAAEGKEYENSYLIKLNKMAATLKEEFNKVHQQGHDLNGEPGIEFFTGNDAFDIDINDSITDSDQGINKIAAAKPVSAELFSSNNKDVVKMDSVNTFDDPDNIIDNFMVDYDDSSGDYTVVALDEEGNMIDSVSDTASGSPETIIMSGSNYDLEFDLELNESGTAYINKLGAENNANALELARVVKEKKLFNKGKSNMLDHYNSVISTLGVEAQRADQMVNNQEVLAEQLNNQQQSISGVSLDEEMANMIKYQQAYNAAAKVISTTDQMMDSLIGILR